MLNIEPIAPDNFEHVVSLLQMRGNTLAEYTRWKYRFLDTSFCGVIGYVAGKPAGCFGVVPRELQLSDQETIKCGWFCDWYVMPKHRGLGLGRELLLALSTGYKIIFGHPGPQKASYLALANGFRPIAFQSRRRLYFNRVAYERIRTRYRAKLIYRLALGTWQSLQDRVKGYISMSREPIPPDSVP